MAPRGPKIAPREPQDGPKSAQERSKSGPRGPLDALFEPPKGGGLNWLHRAHYLSVHFLSAHFLFFWVFSAHMPHSACTPTCAPLCGAALTPPPPRTCPHMPCTSIFHAPGVATQASPALAAHGSTCHASAETTTHPRWRLRASERVTCGQRSGGNAISNQGCGWRSSGSTIPK